MPRMFSSIGTPAREASYSASMRIGSDRLFTFTLIQASCPSRLRAASPSISSSSRERSVSGAMLSSRKLCGSL